MRKTKKIVTLVWEKFYLPDWCGFVSLVDRCDMYSSWNCETYIIWIPRHSVRHACLVKARDMHCLGSKDWRCCRWWDNAVFLVKSRDIHCFDSVNCADQWDLQMSLYFVRVRHYKSTVPAAERITLHNLFFILSLKPLYRVKFSSHKIWVFFYDYGVAMLGGLLPQLWPFWESWSWCWNVIFSSSKKPTLVLNVLIQLSQTSQLKL